MDVDLTARYAKLEEFKPALLTAFGEMEDGIRDFTHLLSAVNVEKALVLEIQYDEPILKAQTPDIITHQGNETAAVVSRVLINIYGSAESPRQHPKKVAGFVKTNFTPDQLAIHLVRINTAKTKIKTIVSSIDDANPHLRDHLRFYFLHVTCGKTSCVPSEVYRLIPYCTEPVNSVSIQWEANNAGYKHPKIYFREIGKPQKKKHNTLPLFLASNSPLAKRNKAGVDQSVRNHIE